MKTYVSSDGTWEVKYPSNWRVKESADAPDEWQLLSPSSASPASDALTDGEAKIEFFIRENEDNVTLDKLLSHYCEVPPGIDGSTGECRKTDINGREWAWAFRHEEVSGGVSGYLVGTIANGRIYESFSGVPDGEHSEAGLAQVREILATFRLNL